MILLVCGSRTMPMDSLHGQLIEDKIKALKAIHPIVQVIHGGARGADQLGGYAAQRLGIMLKVFPADWAAHGKAAGHIRNQEMLDYGPDIVLAFYPDTGLTPGTRDMLNRCKNSNRKLIIEEHTYSSGVK